MLGVIAPFPAIESLGRDAKVAASETGIVIMGVAVIKPFKSLPGFPGQLGDAR
jgi:hypothetical protein